MYYLYDPRTNISSKTSYKELQGITGLGSSSFSKAKSKRRKIKSINCYITEGVASLDDRREWYAAEKYPDEAWLEVQETKAKYIVSNYGRVKKIYKTSERFLLPYQRKGKGNLWVKIDGKELKVGHLVAAHFIREIIPGESVIRKNGIVIDDYVGNLEIVSRKELGVRTGFKSKSKEVVQLDAETLDVVNEYRSAREAGRNYFMSYQAILDRCNGIYKQSDGFIWMFAKDYENANLNTVGGKI